MKICKRTNFPALLMDFILVCMPVVMILLSACNLTEMPVLSDHALKDEIPVERIRISALTEFVQSLTRPEEVQLKVLVEIMDKEDMPVKTNCLWRFEFYEFRALSSDPRGRRLVIWPDQDLRDAGSNNQYWKDFLRSYEFYLPLGIAPGPNDKYVLEATCFIGQYRYSDLFKMQYKPKRDIQSLSQ